MRKALCGRSIINLQFADDPVPLTNSEAELQEIVNFFNRKYHKTHSIGERAYGRPKMTQNDNINSWTYYLESSMSRRGRQGRVI